MNEWLNYEYMLFAKKIYSEDTPLPIQFHHVLANSPIFLFEHLVYDTAFP